MTNNNLRKHISWLLTAKPFVPPPAQHIALTIEDQLPISSAVVSDNFSTATGNVHPDRNPPLRHSALEAASRPLSCARPNALEELGDAFDIGASSRPPNTTLSEMARLRSAPSSAARPRLIVQEQSLRNTPRADWSPRKTGAPDPPLTENKTHRRDLSFSGTPAAPVTFQTKDKDVGLEDIPMEDWDVDAIDLTGDSDSRAESSPVIQALRPTSRKRKSDEFEIDLRVGSAHQRPVVQPGRAEASADGFAPIEDFEDPPPPYSSVANKGPSARSGRQSTSGESSMHQKVPAGENCEIEEQRVFESPTKPIPRKRKPLSKPPLDASDVASTVALRREPSRSPRKVHWSNKNTLYEEKQRNQVQVPPSKRRVIADSEEEDEDEDLGDSEARTMPQSPLLDDPFVEPLRPTKTKGLTRTTSATLVEKAKDFRWHECKGDGILSPQKSDNRASNPTTQHLATSSLHDVHIAKGNGALTAQVLASQQATPPQLTDQEREIISAFSEWPDTQVEAILDSVKLQIEHTNDTISEYLAAYDEVSTELKALVKEQKSQTETLEELLVAKDSLRKAIKKKEEVTRKFRLAIEESLDLSIDDKVLNRTVSSQIRQLQIDILRLLRDVGFLQVSGQSIHLHKPDVNDSNVVIRSTQVTPVAAADSRAHVPDTSVTTHTQYVQQTQIQAPNPILPPRRRVVLPPPAHPETEPAGTDAIGEFLRADSGRRDKSSERRVKDVASIVPAMVEDLVLDENDFGEDEYGTNMGTPPMRGADDDDFDDFEFDEEMLDMTEGLENLGKTDAIGWDKGHRGISQETFRNHIIQSREPVTKRIPVNSAGPPAPLASQLQYSWSRDVKAVLKDRFHLRGFRPHQLEAINATLAGKDCFVLMPTGGGKSLCYQLPSVIYSGKTRGVTVVISPLLSLMEDQVEHLKKLKIQAFPFNGEIGIDQRRQIMSALREPQVEKFVQLLYVAPEMLSKNQTMLNALKALHQRQRLARLVIDEAHCVSQWGHDFRPDYKLLGELRQQFLGVPVMALTATATENVKVDTIHNLGIQGCEVFAQSFNRPNLYYEVRVKGKGTDVLESIADTIKEQYKGQSGIVYCLSRKKCETIAQRLQKEYGIKAAHYHAGMNPQDRSRTQKLWQAGKCNVIVATIAFGMGIDKPDVRFVIHHSIPKSLEGYYQETGRAGRDGKRSGCFLYYGYQDTSALKRMIDGGDGSWQQKERQRAMLRNVVQYCENKSDCRRVQVLAYFNESFQREDCNATCDNCNSNSTFETQDFTEDAVKAINLVKQLEGENVTLLHCVDVFRGAKSKKIMACNHNTLREHGAGAHLERGDVERLFNRLLSEDAFAEHNCVNRAGFASQYIKLGRRCHEFERGRQRVQIHVRVSPKGKGKRAKAALRKKAQTGVAASRDDYPLSTNVSSPIQAASRRRKVRYENVDDLDDFQIHASESDEFVVDNDENDDEDSEGFAPLRTSARSKQAPRELGQPITADQKMESLNDIHRGIVENFVEQAKKECRDIMIKRGLRAQPFTDTMLREMAISFPRTAEEMLCIPNINSEMVKRHGSRFLRLISKASKFYTDMMTAREDERAVLDPNREVVEISDDDDDDDDEYGGDFDLDLENGVGEASSPELRSSYFRQEDDPDVTAFNARFSQSQAPSSFMPPPMPQRTVAASSEAQPRGYSSVKKTNSRRGGRRSSSGPSKGRSSAGVTKKTTNKKRDTGNASKYPGRSFEGSTRRGGGVGGIGMMPV